MATTLQNYNSSLATDPLRTFRFTANFTAVTDSSPGSVSPFDVRIKDGTAGTAGVSQGWAGGFTSVSGLSVTTQNITYREGGYNTTVHQMPGMTTFQPITFSRGVLFGNDQAMAWMRGLFAAASGEGLNATGVGNFRVDVLLKVNKHPATDNSTPQLAFKIHNAWISSLSYTDLDASNGSIMFETMQLVHEGLSVVFTNADGTPADSKVAL